MKTTTSKERPTKNESARRAWQKASSFADLCELTAKFIEGSSPYFPACGAGGVDAETEELVHYLAAFNRSGFLTTCSQPGADDREWKQRACVDGFATESLARRIATVSLYTELHIIAIPPGYDAGFHTPVILRNFMPHGWSGFSCFEELEFFKEGCGEAAFQEMQSTWWISIVDLKWGRNDYLWPSIAQAICYSEKPHPDLGLDTDFAL